MNNIAETSMRVSQETLNSVLEVEQPDQLADVIAANVLTRLEDRQAILEQLKARDRLETLCGILAAGDGAGRRGKAGAGPHQEADRAATRRIITFGSRSRPFRLELGDKDGTDVEELARAAWKKRPLNDEARREGRKGAGTPLPHGSRHAGDRRQPHLCGVDPRPALGQDRHG